MLVTVKAEKGGILLSAEVLPMGTDLLVSVSGGDKPHIGCVSLAVPRPSLADSTNTSATVSTINLTGHKDDAVANRIAERLAAFLGVHVAVVCGIHVNGINGDGIRAVLEAADEITAEIILQFESNRSGKGAMS